MTENIKIASESSLNSTSSNGKIAGEHASGASGGGPEKQETNSMQQRIAASTASGGLKEPLPFEFDDKNGDWQSLKSDNPFEVLYLDYLQFKLIDNTLIDSNFKILKNFWSTKTLNMNVGGNRVAYKTKYGSDDLVTNSVISLENAYKKLRTPEGRSLYFEELEKQRVKIGEMAIQPLIRMMVKDDRADQSEIEGIFHEGQLVGLRDEEISQIIKNVLDSRNFIAYGAVSGSSLKDQLLSVSWMTLEKKKLADEEARVKAERGVDILGRRAGNLIELGEVLFNNETGAKDYINNDILKGSISYFNADKAMEYVKIRQSEKTDQLKYLRVMYRLNPNLPYRFVQKIVKDPVELSKEAFESPKPGKEHLKNGYFEVWFEETNNTAHKVLTSIRDTSENVDIAFLRFIYTFNPKLPFRFAENTLVHTPQELALSIDSSEQNWKNGVTELYNNFILTWLKTTQQTSFTGQWEEFYTQFKDNSINPDYGLEEFIEILNPEIQKPELAISSESIHFPKIQGGRTESKIIGFSNTTRGFLIGSLSFSTPIEGVTLSEEVFICSRYHGGASCEKTLTIATADLLKGVIYKTNIIVANSTGKEKIVPVEFKVVFPISAFTIELLKYALLVGGIFGGLRYSLENSGFPSWLGNQFQTYQSFFINNSAAIQFRMMGILFFAFSIITLGASWILIKYLLKKKKLNPVKVATETKTS